jgi:type I restriction enzyme S subunit
MSDGYKDSLLGKIPNDWMVTTIGDVTTKVQDGNYGASYPNNNEFLTEGIPFITSSAISTNKIDFNKLKHISEEKHFELRKAHIKKDDVILTNRGANVGKCAITPSSLEDANIGPQVTLIRCGENYSFKLLHQVIMSKIIQTQIENANSGSAMNFLSLKVTNALLIPLPPLPEQQKIAEILSTVDAKIEVIDQQITETQVLKKGLMQQLLTGKLSVIEKRTLSSAEMKDSPLGEIPKSWEVVKLEEIGDFFKGKGISKSEILKNGQFPCLRYGEIYTIYDTVIYKFQSFINEESANNSIAFKSGDLLFTGSGETAEDIGKCVTYIGSETPYASGDLIIHRPIKGDSIFLSYCMNSSIIRNQTKKMGQGNAVVHIYTKHLSQLIFAFPPFEEQTQIAEILCSVDEKLEVLSEKKNHFQELKQGLMQQLLTGKIRVNNLMAQI